MDDATAEFIGRALAERNADIRALQLAITCIHDTLSAGAKQSVFELFVSAQDHLEELMERDGTPDKIRSVQRASMDGMLGMLRAGPISAR